MEIYATVTPKRYGQRVTTFGKNQQKWPSPERSTFLRSVNVWRTYTQRVNDRNTLY